MDDEKLGSLYFKDGNYVVKFGLFTPEGGPPYLYIFMEELGGARLGVELSVDQASGLREYLDGALGSEHA